MAWLGIYKYRYKMLIPAGTVLSTQNNFPVTVKLGLVSGINDLDTTFIFEVLADNYLKMAITDADETTQLYCEVEKWDSANANGCIHFKKPSITTSDNYYYIYFDDTQADNTTYVGKEGSAPALNVWSSITGFVDNFGGSDPLVMGDAEDGLIGKARVFDETADQIDISSYMTDGDGALEFLIKIDPENATGNILKTYKYDEARYRYGLTYGDNNYHIMQEDPSIIVVSGGLEIQVAIFSGVEAKIQKYETWQHIVVMAGTTPNIYVDGEPFTVGTTGLAEFYSEDAEFAGESGTYIGDGLGPGDSIPGFEGLCQSLRFWEETIDADLIKASYLNMTDEFTTLVNVQFYDNIVNGNSFDILGDRSYPVYFKLLIAHDSYDDLLVPIENFQFRHTTGNEAYLSVVIPDFSYYDSIVLRDGGQMRLHMLTGTMTDLDRDNLVVQVDLDADNIRYDEGSDSKPINLDGYGVYGSRYLSLDLPDNSYKTYENENGTYRFRFPGPFYYLRTNDTVIIDGTEIDVLDMSANRAGNGGQMELSDNG